MQIDENFCQTTTRPGPHKGQRRVWCLEGMLTNLRGLNWTLGNQSSRQGARERKRNLGRKGLADLECVVSPWFTHANAGAQRDSKSSKIKKNHKTSLPRCRKPKRHVNAFILAELSSALGCDEVGVTRVDSAVLAGGWASEKRVAGGRLVYMQV